MTRCFFLILALAMVFLPPLPAWAETFSWNRNALFAQLEEQFSESRKLSAEDAMRKFETLAAEGHRDLTTVEQSGASAPLGILEGLESIQFRMAAIAAAHHDLLKPLQAFIAKVHATVISASSRWTGPGNERLRASIYRVLYGGRSAIEEAWIQNQAAALPEILTLHDAASTTPLAVIGQVVIHSGDIVLSRAGAPTSALIARGNDYPGNFSHVALVYVDASTHQPLVIESLIERGLITTDLSQYLKDKKQRILLLRLRPNHPTLVRDPMLPHNAAKTLLAKARLHAGYDFAMDWTEDKRLFCSEVPYQAYHAYDINLWRFKTTVSSPGLRRWLGDMGVTHFETIAPSDLEYDPNLVSVAEWRDSNVLKADHGLRLGYPAYQWPLARAVKVWSRIQAIVGLDPVIPEGMGPGAALRVSALVDHVFPVLRATMERKAQDFVVSKGYEPPYWTLLRLALETVEEHRTSLSPSLVVEGFDAANNTLPAQGRCGDGPSWRSP